MNMLLRGGFGIILSASLFAIGCGGTTHTASGKVTLDGKPLSNGGVTLVSADPNEVAIHSGTTNESGNFSIQENQSTPIKPGEYIVVVDKVPQEMDGVSIVPEIYRSQTTSPLRATISGESTVLPKIQLKSAQ